MLNEDRFQVITPVAFHKIDNAYVCTTELTCPINEYGLKLKNNVNYDNALMEFESKTASIIQTKSRKFRTRYFKMGLDDTIINNKTFYSVSKWKDSPSQSNYVLYTNKMATKAYIIGTAEFLKGLDIVHEEFIHNLLSPYDSINTMKMLW